MKKIGFSIFAFFIAWFANSQSFDDFYKLDFYTEAKMNYLYALQDCKSAFKYFEPGMQFSASGSTAGYFDSDFTQYSQCNSVSYVQNFPGLTSLSVEIKNNLSYSSFSDSFMYNLCPGVSFSVPLIFSSSEIAEFNKYGAEYRKGLEKLAALNYKLALNEGRLKCLQVMGESLFYEEAERIYGEFYELYCRKEEDCEKVFQLGRLSLIELKQVGKEKNEYLQKKVEAESKYFSARQSCEEMGIENKWNSIKDFMEFCEKNFSLNENDMSYSKLEDEKELVSVELEMFSALDSMKNSVPFFTASFEAGSNYGNHEIDFDGGSWAVNFSVTVPVFNDFCGIGNSRKISYLNKYAVLKKKSLVQKQNSTRLLREKNLAVYENYCKSVKEEDELEKKRYETFIELSKIGRISNFDIKIQELSVKIAALNSLYAELQLLLLRCSFY